MSKSEPIVTEGKQIGKLKASWLLFKESWRYLNADKEMVLIPLIASILNLLLFGLVMGLCVVVFWGGDFSMSKEGEPLNSLELMFVLLLYIVSAFTLAISQSGIAHTVNVRAHDGDSTLGQALNAAFSRWYQLLIWSVITATVGLFLRMIVERSKLLGRIVAYIAGAAWAIVTYFVVPSIIIGNKSAFASIGHSKEVFKSTWGETFVSNISLGLTFLVAHLLAIITFIGLVVMFSVFDMAILIPLVFVGYVLWVIVAVLVQSSLEAILKTLLYIYATERTFPPNFNPEILEKMLNRKDVQLPPLASVPKFDAGNN